MQVESGEADQLPKFDTQASRALADRLHVLKLLNPKFSHAAFAVAAGVDFGKLASGSKSFGERLSRWIRMPSRLGQLGEQNYKKLVAHLLKTEPSLRDHMQVPNLSLLRSPLYHAIAPLLHCESKTDALNFMSRVTGAYKIYRPSVLENGYGYIGRLDIKYDKRSDSYITRERYIRNSAQEWDMSGALYPMTLKIFATVAIDHLGQTVQLKYFNDIFTTSGKLKSKPQQISGFTGWVADVEGQLFYTTRLYVESIDESEPVNLEYKLVKDFPPNVVRHLNKTLNVSGVVYHE